MDAKDFAIVRIRHAFVSQKDWNIGSLGSGRSGHGLSELPAWRRLVDPPSWQAWIIEYHAASQRKHISLRRRPLARQLAEISRSHEA